MIVPERSFLCHKVTVLLLWHLLFLVVHFSGFNVVCKVAASSAHSISISFAFCIPQQQRQQWSCHRRQPQFPRSSQQLPLLSTKEADEDAKYGNTIISSDTTSMINRLIEERSIARWNANYNMADELKKQIQTLSPSSDYEIVLCDKPRKEGGVTTWTLQQIRRSDSQVRAYMSRVLPGPTVLQLAHAALGAAVEASVETSLARARAVVEESRNQPTWQHHTYEQSVKTTTIKTTNVSPLGDVVALSRQASDRLQRLQQSSTILAYEVGGRKAADAAFWFALAGCQDQSILERLADVASTELERLGARPSCRSKDVHQILERFAAAGLQRHERLQKVAGICLIAKNAIHGNDRDGEDQIRGSLDFHSNRSLLLIWKFSTKQKKQYAFLNSARKHWESRRRSVDHESAQSTLTVANAFDRYDWDALFDDPMRPLVVDIGCGYGVSLLGLASLTHHDEASRVLLAGKCETRNLTWSDCNFIGVDLGELGIRYATGLAHRWGLSGRLQFVVDAAEDFCGRLHSYPGTIVLFLCQFPTPYRLSTDHRSGKGNLQLPASQDDGFMVTQKLLGQIHSILRGTRGRLLLQSNVEDVAVYMRNLACQDSRFFFIQEDDLVLKNDYFSKKQRIPQRTTDWVVKLGGERATGRGWFQRPIFCRSCTTETEAACELNATPVHRCVLEVQND